MPLSTKGICAQILGSLSTYHDFKTINGQPELIQTINDCKVVLNHLIRKFSEPKLRNGSVTIYRSEGVSRDISCESIIEHVIPVALIMDELLSWTREKIVISIENINELEEFLSRVIMLAEITAEEDKKLRDNKLHCSAPGWTKDPWRRYKDAEIAMPHFKQSDGSSSA